MTRVLGLAVILASMAGFAFAGLNAPEIDGATGPAAVGLLVGALLVLRARKKSR